MTLTLTPEQTAMVEELVQHGVFDTPNEVLDAALDLLAERKEEYDRQLAELRAEVALGDADIERGDVVEFDPEDMLRRIRAARENARQEAVAGR